jgi:hypothetical protein
MYVSPDFNAGKFSSSWEITITLEEHLRARALEAEAKAKAWTLKAKDMILFLEDYIAVRYIAAHRNTMVWPINQLIKVSDKICSEIGSRPRLQ